MKQLWAVVLAAGEGKRMYSCLPKVLHPLCGKPMLSYVLESAAELTDQILVVVGHGASQVQDALGDKWRYVLQEQQLGTGHAVMQAFNGLPHEGTLLVLCGDTPLLESEHLKQLLARREQFAATVATTILPDPDGYGRIVRSESDVVERIVENRDASEEEKKIDEINTGTYCFDLELLKDYLPLLTIANVQNEYYLTDVIALMHRDGHKVGTYLIDDHRVGIGINNRAQLAEAARMLRERINRSLMLSGVTITDPNSAYIDYGLEISPESVILPNCLIEKGTVIGPGCRIGPNTHLSNAVVKDRAVVQHSVIVDSVIESDQKVGPFTHIRSKEVD